MRRPVAVASRGPLCADLLADLLTCWVRQLAQRCTWMWAAGTCRAHRDAEAAGDVGARIFGTGQRRRQGDRPRISTVLAGFQRS
jgi:hypothetical protein